MAPQGMGLVNRARATKSTRQDIWTFLGMHWGVACRVYQEAVLFLQEVKCKQYVQSLSGHHSLPLGNGVTV